ncbi:exonuclease SBCC [Cryptosporidium sp. chipmunk genotype I]|uniref:exonuclease SBCC n=1 Tax=Cryptosporidium sp. chipmunk genotype I TaxID=1280935 RepID=UPI00351A4F31|nr:exonuclease SBCC [Cryptosporidium sp. chipmunk genotype I]
MREFDENVDYNDELCVKALNNLNRPPEVDEPFLEFFRPKPKLRIKQKLRGKSLDTNDASRVSGTFGEELEQSGSNNAQKSVSAGRSELNTLHEDYYIRGPSNGNNNIRRVRSEMEKFNKVGEGMKAENLLSSILIFPDQFGKKGGSRTEVRKRKLNSSGSIDSSTKDEFLSVATPISPYVISPKSNNFDYSSGNAHNKKLTEKNIDLLKSLIEIKEKELNNLNTSYSYEKSEFKLEIIRLKQIIKESEESHLQLQKEIVEKDEALAESRQRYEKLELDFVSTKQSLEIMLEAERNANQRLRQELREKNVNDSSLGYFGENSILELQSYKLKYFEAMRKLQRLETEMVISRNKGYKLEEDREFVNNDSVPIFVGLPENKQYISEYSPQNLQTNLEVCLNIKEGFDEIRSDTEIIQLVSENSILQEKLIKLREELEMEKNKSIVANIRHLTQRPILISSCTSTRLSMHEIEAMEAKSTQFEQKYEQTRLRLKRNLVKVQILYPKNQLNIQKLGNLGIQTSSNFELKLDRSVQTHVDENMCEHANTGNITIGMHNVGSDATESVEKIQDEIRIENDKSFYDLAFNDYNFAPKLLNNYAKNSDTQDEYECEKMDKELNSETEKEDRFKNDIENYKNKSIGEDLCRSYLIGRKCEFLKRVLLELKFDIVELRNVVMKFIGQPQNFTEITKSLIKNGCDMDIDFYRREHLLETIAFIVSKIYSMYLKTENQVEEFLLKDKDWRSYSNKLESELNKNSLEKSELITEINYLRRMLNESVEKEKMVNADKVERGVNVPGYNGNDDVISCYTFGESSSVNLENEVEWNIDDFNITKLMNSKNNVNVSNIEPFNTELEIVEESKSITKVKNESDSFNKIVKLQGRIRSFKQNQIKLQSIEKNDDGLNNQIGKSLIPFKKNVFHDKSEVFNAQENIEFEEMNSLLFRHSPPQMSGDELATLGELEGMTGTAMMLRLYRYYKQTKLLEKQVIQISKEKQKLELEYEKDAQSIQMNLLSSKLIIEARDMEIKTLKEKCEFLSSKVEDDIKNIKSAAREEIEKVWKPKVEEINSKCEDYLFKISSLESELLILRQQLAFQKQLNFKETKKSEYSNIIKGKYLTGANSDKYKQFSKELMEKISYKVDSFELKRSNDINDDVDDDESDSLIENNGSVNIKSAIEVRGEDSDDQNISSLKSALTRLKTISNEYKSFN